MPLEIWYGIIRIGYSIVISRVVGSRMDAEDLVQEAFVQAYLNLASFRGHCSFYTWLYRIALNLAYSNARRRQVRKALERTREVSEEIPADSTASPSERMERAEESERIRRALSALSERASRAAGPARRGGL